MQDEIQTMARRMLAAAFRDMAATLDGTDAPAQANWPRMKAGETPSGDHGRADVYVAECSALSRFAQRLQIPIFKIGATRQPLLTRQADLRADRYGAAVQRDGAIVAEPGFDDWEMRRLEPLEGVAEIAFVPRALRVDLAMPFARFETGLRDALRPHGLATWANSASGRAHLDAIGVEESATRRFTLYGFGDQVRGSPCNELYVIRPRADLPMICDAIKRAVRGQRDMDATTRPDREGPT